MDAEHIPAGMELFGGAGTVIDTIKKWIDASDIFMLLLGGKYGSIYEEEGISYTEWEYNYAKLIEKKGLINIEKREARNYYYDKVD